MAEPTESPDDAEIIELKESLPPIHADLTQDQLDRLLAPLNELERALLLARLKRSDT